MYFLYHDKKRFLNLEGNLIITHNERLVMGNNKKSTPQHITGGMFVKVVRESGFWRRVQASRAALAFIWGESQARNQTSDNEYLAKVATAEKIDGNAMAAAGETRTIKKGLAPGPTQAVPGCYGSNPGPQDQAEKDCSTCPDQLGCIL